MWRRKNLYNSLGGLVVLLCSVAVCSGEDLSGTVRWSGQVELSEPVVVGPKATLTIAAGSNIVAKTPQAKIRVQGILRVEGKPDAPVRFSGAQGWQGVEFMEAPHDSEIRWAEFSSAKAAISSFGTDFKVAHTVFKNNEFAIRLLRESSPEITNSTFENNQIGVANEMKSGAHIRDNRFVNHGRTAILASHNSTGPIIGNTFSGNKQALTLLRVYNDQVKENLFVDNEVGIYCNQTQSTPYIAGNRFENNKSGILNFSFDYPKIENNQFINNTTALHNDQYGSPEVQHNLFRGNETAIYNYRKSDPKVLRNRFEKNDLALFCDFSAYPKVKDNDFIGNAMGVKLGIYQSADWEKRSGSKTIMQRESAARQTQNPLLAQAPDQFNDYVDVSGNWWGDDTERLVALGEGGNSPLFHDRHDQPEVTYEDFGPGVYALDWVKYAPWLEAPVEAAGPLDEP